MRFTEAPLPGAWLIELKPISDERGWFARTFDADEFRAHGIDATVAQCNSSFNRHRDTVRGMHYQREPHGEAKLVRCPRGAIFDVAVDLRPASPTYCEWYGAELTEDNARMLFLPAGLAHGFQTLTADCEVQYQMGHRYVPEATAGVRWDDPAFAIDWPAPAGRRTIAQRDLSYPDFEPCE